MKTFDAIVIGSGFGGAVSACRLAQAGLSVCILERGKDYRKHPYPRNYTNVLDGWLYGPHERGLYDVNATSEMIAIQGAGYGGGSLVYANVQMRPPPDVFEQGWPAGYSRAALDPYYDLVAYMLDVKPFPKAQWRESPKTPLMYSVAEKLGREAQIYAPNLAVRFEGGDQPTPNKFGAPQRACTFCGECDVGCSVGAKNTLDVNYLHVAEKHGAEARTECEVLRIGPRQEGGYRVVYRAPDGTEQSADARSVFLCAGAIHSTELLLRCRDEYQTLPRLSPHLGERYSGNGDFLALIFEPKDLPKPAPELNPARGPTITSSLLYDRGKGDERHWFVVQDGGVPKQVLALLRLLSPDFDGLLPPGFGSAPLIKLRNNGSREAHTAGWSDVLGAPLQASLDAFLQRRPEQGPLVLLAMGRDRATGKIELSPHTHCLRVIWDVESNAPLYATQTRICQDLADAVGGKLVLAPGWQYLRKPVSVHNLGGCSMADKQEDGVTSPIGELHGYPNLFVLDGGILPESTGVNPSHTIAAVAERNVEAFIRRETRNAAWRAKEWSAVKPTLEPLDQIKLPSGGVKPPKRAASGLSFRESMVGFLRREARANGHVSMQRAAAARIDVTVSILSIDEFIADQRHTAAITGRVWAGDFTGPDGIAVGAGRFHLFAPGESRTRELNYELPFYGQDGKPYLFTGYKRVPDSEDLRPWRATTTLVSFVREGHAPDGPILATGILRLSMPALVKQLTTFRTPGARTPRESLLTLSRFGRLFVDKLVSSYTDLPSQTP